MCHEDRHILLWKDPWGKELRHPANSSGSEISWQIFLAPVKFSDGCYLPRDPETELPT